MLTLFPCSLVLKQIAAVVSTGVVGPLVQLLGHEETGVKIPALRAVGNIVTGSEQETQAVIEANALPFLKQMLYHNKKNIRKVRRRTDLDTLCQSFFFFFLCTKYSSPFWKIFSQEACWALSNITAGSPEQIEEVLRLDLLQDVAGVLRNDEYDVRKEALWTLSNSTCGCSSSQMR